MTAKDFMNDFATEDFITKNIRVRPISGKDIEEKSEKGGFASLGDLGDEDEKFNKMQDLEMDDQRKKIKVIKEEIERKKQAEVEKEMRRTKRK